MQSCCGLMISQPAFHTQPLDSWKLLEMERGGGGGKRFQDCIIQVRFSSKEGGDTMSVDDCRDKSASSVVNQTNVPTKDLGLGQLQGY